MKKLLIAIFVVSLAACAQKKSHNENSGENSSSAGEQTQPANEATQTDAQSTITNPATPSSPATVADASNSPIITFENDHVTLKEAISEGETVEVMFKFTNTGKAPLVISDVVPGCGCTTPFWTKDPIAPGAKGKITAKFDSKDKGTGMITKMITVKSNTPYPDNEKKIEFTVQVNPK